MYFKAVDTSNRQQVCIKSVNCDTMDSNPLFSEATLSEIKFFQVNPIQSSVVLHKALKSKQNFYIITSYADGGSLKDMIDRFTFVSESLALHLML